MRLRQSYVMKILWFCGLRKDTHENFVVKAQFSQYYFLNFWLVLLTATNILFDFVRFPTRADSY